jgi:hypothetical protein
LVELAGWPVGWLVGLLITKYWSNLCAEKLKLLEATVNLSKTPIIYCKK